MAKKELPSIGGKSYEDHRQVNDHDAEFWSARELQPLLGYSQWRRFEDAIRRAITSCEQSGNDPEHHFAGAGKPITGGTLPRTGMLERRGHTLAATFHLAKGIAKDLLGKAAYTKTRGLNPIRYAEMIKAYLQDHGSITPMECRELLGLGESQSAKVEISRYLKAWTVGSNGFLVAEGHGNSRRYFLGKKVE